MQQAADVRAREAELSFLNVTEQLSMAEGRMRGRYPSKHVFLYSGACSDMCSDVRSDMCLGMCLGMHYQDVGLGIEHDREQLRARLGELQQELTAAQARDRCGLTMTIIATIMMINHTSNAVHAIQYACSRNFERADEIRQLVSYYNMLVTRNHTLTLICFLKRADESLRTSPSVAPLHNDMCTGEYRV